MRGEAARAAGEGGLREGEAGLLADLQVPDRLLSDECGLTAGVTRRLRAGAARLQRGQRLHPHAEGVQPAVRLGRGGAVPLAVPRPRVHDAGERGV